MSSGKAARTSLIVFADDWGRHPSSCQHLMRELLPNHQIMWVNTIGMRTPKLNLATLRRGTEKLRDWMRTPAVDPSSDEVMVINPVMWPWCGTAAGRRLNQCLLAQQLSRLVRTMPHPRVAITTVPLVADLIGRLPVDRWVYYCVDDFTVWPGLDQQTLARTECDLIDRADAVVAVSETLKDRLQSRGRMVELVTHGVKIDHWQVNVPKSLPALDGLEPPLVTFWGLIDRRMDADFVRHLAESLREGTVLLVGPQQDQDASLFQTPRVKHLSAMPYADLPHLAEASSVLVMPYADLPVTRAIQPLKLKEYLATSKPVVVRDLPATRPWNDCADLASTAAEFAELVCQRVLSGVPIAQQRARLRLSAESWSAKAHQFERLALAGMPAVAEQVA